MSRPQSPTLRAVILDTGPLGLLCNPKGSIDSTNCLSWVKSLSVSNVRVIVPEIADYELRRELLRARLFSSVRMLDQIYSAVDYLPLNTAMMRQAAAFWADIRQGGQPTADRHALDGDVIVAAQTVSLGYSPDAIVVATTNTAHISRFVAAKLWQDI